MGIQSYIRRLAGQTCHNLTEQFTPTFGAPVDLAFGDIADEGTSEDFARADHRHGMPDQSVFIDDIENFATIFKDLDLTTNASDIKTLGTVAFGGRDDPGETGAFGSLDVLTGLANGGTTGSAAVYLQNSSGGAAGNTNTQLHPFKRTRQFLCRARPVLTQLQLQSMSFACGFIRTTTNGDVGTITDGVFFRLVTDGAGAGTYHIVAMDSTTTTDTDTGVSPRVDGGNNVLFDVFRITFDGTTAAFLINGNAVGTITAGIPSAGRKLAGFGAFVTNNAVVQRTMVVDVIAWTGLRSYTE